ncbi:hypothetical protein [Planctomyces sp. SH-PL62]|uniref:hypothetical protein n=1 Tax=Planctomyces sp. SH-PL62 TaxID=1636152 RepID=UPI00078DCFC2|nr:hypothetical protein [Planctomyces sp. SH-PL62]AMV38303.1 hypothetical protein VT85_12755 [Planctomyces sp. SH-PL62]
MKRKSCRPVSEQLESRALMTVFLVTSAAGAGPGTLRAAINQANQTPGGDVIEFQLPSDAPIRPGGQALPPITGKVVIDGYTQAGASPNTSTDPSVNNAHLTVQIIKNGGSGPIMSVNPRGGGSRIRGISFINEGAGAPSGIEINQADLVSVDGNAFGAVGQSRLGAAVRIVGGSRNTIGGGVSTTPALQNVLGTYNAGVELVGPSKHNAVVGNLIGRDTYSSRVQLQAVGVWLRSAATNNTVVKNVLYKNVTAIKNEAAGNVIEDNTIVTA